eukprot:4303206-Pyramimonas_sp.AAC.1
MGQAGMEMHERSWKVLSSVLRRPVSLSLSRTLPLTLLFSRSIGFEELSVATRPIVFRGGGGELMRRSV